MENLRRAKRELALNNARILYLANSIAESSVDSVINKRQTELLNAIQSKRVKLENIENLKKVGEHGK